MALYAALRQLVDEGFMSEAEFHRMAVPTVGRSLAELNEPFSGGSFEGLALDHAQVFLGPDPIWEDFGRDGDEKAYGARWAAFSRASVLPTLALALALALDGNGAERTAEFLEKAEADMAARLAMAPEKFPIPLGLVGLRKE